MRTKDDYDRLREYLDGLIRDRGGDGDKLPILWLGGLSALMAMNSTKGDVIEAFDRIFSEQYRRILSE
jgi:hypothetical protein